MNPNLDNILDLMMKDWKKAFESNLIISESEERSLLVVAKQGLPHVVYAAWQYYLEDDWMHDKGTPGVDQFVRHVTRYTMKVGKGMKQARAARSGEGTVHTSYHCEYNHWMNNEIWHYSVTGRFGDDLRFRLDKLPAVHEKPCPVCGGRCYKKWIVNRRENYEYEGMPEYYRTMRRVEMGEGNPEYNAEVLAWLKRKPFWAPGEAAKALEEMQGKSLRQIIGAVAESTAMPPEPVDELELEDVGGEYNFF
jgi:hypothetical protein